MFILHPCLLLLQGLFIVGCLFFVFFFPSSLVHCTLFPLFCQRIFRSGRILFFCFRKINYFCSLVCGFLHECRTPRGTRLAILEPKVLFSQDRCHTGRALRAFPHHHDSSCSGEGKQFLDLLNPLCLC